MRRNLRLDWRALALLGALLSIIIDWPGLVYAMPTILPPVAAIAADAAPIDTLNIIKNDKILNFFPAEAANDHPHQKDSKMKNEFTTTSHQILNENLNSFSTTTVPTPSTSIYSEEMATETETEQQPPTQRLTTTINEKQQVNENYNSISDNNKQINDKKQENDQEEITAIHKTQQQQQNSQDESAAVQKVSLLNTHTKNSTTNIISLSKSTNNTQPTISTTPPPPSTTESSAKIQSTLMPTTLAEPSANDDELQQHQQQQPPFNSHLTNTNLRNNFKFSSSHHLAILSRTERSIRSSSSSSSSSANVSSWGMPLASSGSSSSRSSSTGGVGVLVRRSSDMSVLKSKRLNNSRNLQHKNNLDRNERSTVSHLSGPSRKIQLYIKNRFIQLLPDGTVNGTQDEQCDYTILQRSTVEVGRIKIQGVATCLYLCMDPCGAVYGSKEFTDDCVFNESMEQHNYNTYSSTYNSNTRRKYYLALNRHGEPRKLQIPPSRSLGKLATYTNAIPETVPQERVEQLIAKNFGANRVKHGIRQLCDTGKPLIELIDSKNFKARPKCNPNNSNNNNNSNSKNTLSRNLDKENSLVNPNNNNHPHTNGQVLNNVPVANDKNNLSSNSRSSSSSSNSNSRPETNRDSSSSSPSSISISQNNGHISNSISNSKHTSSSNSHSDSSTATSSISNSTAPQTGSHRGGKKAGKKRKCRRFENEEQHNCTTPLNRPTSFTKRGNQLGPIRQQKCRDLLLQQQQAGVTDIVLPPMCTKKGGSKKQQGNNRRGQGKNGLGTDGLGPNNRRGKKLNMNRGAGGGGAGRQAAKNNQNNANNNGGSKKKQKNSKRGGINNPNNNNKKNNKKASGTTTEKTAASTSTQSSSTSTLRPKFWETTSLMPSTTLFDNYDPHAETTSDRGDREQRNVRYSNSMEEYMEQSSEDTSAAEDPEDDDNDMENNDEMNEDASYEDDSYAGPSSSSHIPYTAAESSHTPLTAGADDFLYYDQLDFLPMGLWEFIAVLWILAWSLQTLS
ncbi:probable serine/threonine-protein kinase DDB_G0282963 isoform X2 [Calliphora vicina]|uniref:probable serine/threonine-protein kinase DDB_G0282963 isoform X2 n=1 Tax=Calliphora vicina TaxID=7373 RepID=UPI00325A9080